MSYVQFKKHRIYEARAVSKDYPSVKDWQTMRVLVVTDPETSNQEHESLIQTARTIDKHDRGLRLFWFSRASDFCFDGSDSFCDKRSWRTPAKGEPQKSLLARP